MRGIVDEDDPVLTLIRESQFVDGSNLSVLDPSSPQYRARLAELAESLHSTIANREQLPPVDDERPEDSGEELGFLDDLPELSEDVGRHAEECGHDLTVTVQQLQKVIEGLPSDGLTTRHLAKANRELHPYAERLDASSSALANDWQRVDRFLASFRQVSLSFGSTSADESIRDLAGTLAVSLAFPGEDVLRAQLDALARTSRYFRPAARSLTATLTALEAIRSSTESWLRQLDERSESDV